MTDQQVDRSFSITVSGDASARTLRFHNEFDLSAVASAEAVFSEALAESESVILDLSGLSFLDSIGIGFFISAIRRDEYGKVSFEAAVSPAVVRVLEVSGLGADFGAPRPAAVL